MKWLTSRFELDLLHPKIMAVVNITPDSFSDGGARFSPHAAVRHCEDLLVQGADILDLGAESTRPGAPPVPLEEEWQRLAPVLTEALKLGVPVSVDTYKPEVMARALDAGCDIINDIWALRLPGARHVVASHPRCGVCLMHMHGEPASMQLSPMTGEIVSDVLLFLEQQIHVLQGLGIDFSRICVDPGVGFGKTVEQNFSLLTHQSSFNALGAPVLMGWSRKSSLGAVTGLPVHERLIPSVAAALLSVERGARVVRVHDVAATRQALQVWEAARLVGSTQGAQA